MIFLQWTLFIHGKKANVLPTDKTEEPRNAAKSKSSMKKKRHEQMKRAHRFKPELKMPFPSLQRAAGVSLERN